MKGVCLNSANDVCIKEVEQPKAKENEVVIKVKSLGVCGSDVGAYRGTNPLVTYPRIIGHEIAGIVTKVPENNLDIKVNDRVIIEPYIYCGDCYPCSLGRTNCCEELKVLGVHVDGGMVEEFAHPIHLVKKVPENILWGEVPLAEPLTIALHSLHRSRVKEGEHVVICGAGPIGVMAGLVAQVYGAEPILIDPVQSRLDFAKNQGIKYTVNPVSENAVEVIKEITKGRMAEAVIEASGANASIKSMMDYASYAGRISLVGWPKGEISILTSMITKKELDIVGSRTSSGEFQEALELISSKKVDVKPFISSIVPLEGVPEALVDLSEHPDKYMKIVAVL